jgi:inner membrane protein
VVPRQGLNRRAEQLVGTVATLDQAIEGGRGRVKIDDAFWTVEGADLPLGTRVRVIAVNGMTLKVQEA